MAFLKSDTSEQKPSNILKTVALGIATLVLAGIPLFYLPYTQDPINVPKTMFLVTGVLLLFLVWLFGVVQAKNVVIRRTVLDKALLAFVGIVALSSAVSVIPAISFLGKTSDFVFHAAAVLAFVGWYFLLVQYITDSRLWRYAIHVLLLSGIVAGALFLFRSQPFVKDLLLPSVFNTISASNSVFAVFMALIGALSVGLLLVRSRSVVAQAIAGICAVVALAVLVRAGFTVAWGTYAVALGLVLVVGISFLRGTYVVALSGTFFLLLVSILFAFFTTPAFLKTPLPVEVALGAAPSWSVAQDTFLDSAKQFLLGSGPGTFTQDFSLHRSASFNTSDVAWAVRFEYPYNVVFGLLAEVGLLGLVSFIFLVLLSIGSMLSAWMKMRPVLSFSQTGVEDGGDPIRLEIFVFVAVFIAATIGMGFVFYDLAIWWLWWTLLALSTIGLSALVPALVQERVHMLRTSPQYALVSSFGMVLVFTGVIVFGIAGTRFYMADVAYASATKQSGDAARASLKEAVELRPGYAPYLTALSQAHFEHAKQLASNPNTSPQVLVAAVADAINTAREAADIWGNDVETWQTLGLMYKGAQAFDPEALTWAAEAFDRAIELEPTNPLLHWHAGQIAVSQKRYAAATEYFEASVRLKPNYIPASTDLARLYEAQGDLDNAIAVYEPIFQRIAGQPEMLFHLGRLFYNRNSEGDIDRAIQVWVLAVQAQPAYVNALYSLGLAYESIGDNATAVEYFGKVEELIPESQDIRTRVESLLQQPELPSEEE